MTLSRPGRGDLLLEVERVPSHVVGRMIMNQLAADAIMKPLHPVDRSKILAHRVHAQGCMGSQTYWSGKSRGLGS